MPTSDTLEKTYVKTGHSAFDNFIPQIKAFMEQDSLDVVIDGKPIRGYRSPDAKSLWIRDFSDILRSIKYFEKDLESMVKHFAYTAGKNEWLQFQITDDTYWGIMHGDNSGYYEAFILLSRIYEYFKKDDIARIWRARADKLRTNMNRICWNGTFYWHFVKLTPVNIPDIDESTQLSLSNPMDINRGVPTHLMAASILQEYIRRKGETEAFAEWFSIDPPFPDGIFGDERLKRGVYVNGGIMPLVGGELARAAFEHGFEDYGVDILLRYAQVISESNATYLWYFPDGRPCTAEESTSPEASSTDGWGSSAMRC